MTGATTPAFPALYSIYCANNDPFNCWDCMIRHVLHLKYSAGHLLHVVGRPAPELQAIATV